LKLLGIQTHREHRRECLEDVAHGTLEAAWRGIGCDAHVSGAAYMKTQQHAKGRCKVAPAPGSVQQSLQIAHHEPLLALFF
jgi:hypothetical protein